jgi:hypothetical protein
VPYSKLVLGVRKSEFNNFDFLAAIRRCLPKTYIERYINTLSTLIGKCRHDAATNEVYGNHNTNVLYAYGDPSHQFIMEHPDNAEAYLVYLRLYENEILPEYAMSDPFATAETAYEVMRSMAVTDGETKHFHQIKSTPEIRRLFPHENKTIVSGYINQLCTNWPAIPVRDKKQIAIAFLPWSHTSAFICSAYFNPLTDNPMSYAVMRCDTQIELKPSEVVYFKCGDERQIYAFPVKFVSHSGAVSNVVLTVRNCQTKLLRSARNARYVVDSFPADIARKLNASKTTVGELEASPTYNPVLTCLTRNRMTTVVNGLLTHSSLVAYEKQDSTTVLYTSIGLLNNEDDITLEDDYYIAGFKAMYGSVMFSVTSLDLVYDYLFGSLPAPSKDMYDVIEAMPTVLSRMLSNEYDWLKGDDCVNSLCSILKARLEYATTLTINERFIMTAIIHKTLKYAFNKCKTYFG